MDLEKSYFEVSFSDEENYKTNVNIAHHHRFYEIYYLLKNEVMYYIDNNVYHTVPGTVVVIPPNTIHTTRTLRHGKRRRIIIYLTEDYIKNFLEDDKDLLNRIETPPFLIEEYRRSKIEDLFSALFKEYKSDNSNAVLMKSYLGQLLVELGKATEEGIHSNIKNSDNPTIKQMVKIADYINKHYNEKITLASLSKMFYLNPTYISRSFKQKINIPFSEYLKSVRIKEVCKLLETTDLNLAEIALQTGFSDSSDLCRSFKEAMNTTPTKYKRQGF